MSFAFTVLVLACAGSCKAYQQEDMNEQALQVHEMICIRVRLVPAESVRTRFRILLMLVGNASIYVNKHPDS